MQGANKQKQVSEKHKKHIQNCHTHTHTSVHIENSKT